MNKYNLDNFLIDVKNIHNDKYDYSKIEWKNKTTKIIIICKEHGEFKQTPSNHLLGKGCSYCSGVGRITKNIFLERVQLIYLIYIRKNCFAKISIAYFCLRLFNSWLLANY